ncbi:coelomocyte uptake defective protein 15-like [Brevipalpus obovatus]|uniref:coelomocyte uptake defective protein 15-like n=1 Tax=Brevipalpus obovatus TaxID=246614 RepID=UPI003D9E9A5F
MGYTLQIVIINVLTLFFACSTNLLLLVNGSRPQNSPTNESYHHRVAASIGAQKSTLSDFSNSSTDLKTLLSLSDIKKKFQKKPDECTEVLIAYISASTIFEKCYLNYSKPFRVCLSCADGYYNLSTYYHKIDSLWKDKKCHSIISRKIIDRNYAQNENIWDSGYCDDCFTLRESNSSYIESNDTITFKRQIHQVIDCYQNLHRNVCSECLTTYKDLGNMFDSLYTKHDTGLCLDLSYLMGHVVNIWEHKYKCQVKYTPLTTLLVFSAIIASSTLLFYGVMRCTQKPSPRPTLSENRSSFMVNTKGRSEFAPLLKNGDGSPSLDS